MRAFVTAVAAAAVLCVYTATASAQDTKAAEKGKPAPAAKTAQAAKTAPVAKTAEKGQKTAADPLAIEKGQKIFADQKCSMCHSVAGKGNPKGSLDNVGSELSAEEIRQWLLSPRVMADKKKSDRKPLMAAYTKLTATELDSLVAYLKSLKKK
jgi:cytochrome c1